MLQSAQELQAPSAVELPTVSVPVKVVTDYQGNPSAVRLGRWVGVVGVLDCWRADDEWWEPQAKPKTYYKVALQNGFDLTIFREPSSGKWYQEVCKGSGLGAPQLPFQG